MSVNPDPHRSRVLEHRYQRLVESIKDYAIYMLTPDGYVDSWNAGAQRFKGYSADDIIGRHFSCFYTPEDRAAGIPARGLHTARVAGKFETEGWRVRQDGTRFWAHVVIDPVYDDDGELLGFAKITRDITERHQAQQALAESERRFRYLVKGVTDYAIYMLSPSGVITNWNSGAERIKGYLAEEVVGSHFSRFYTDEDRAAGRPDFALSTARAEGRFEAEGWRVRKDGTRFWAHVVIDAVYEDDGQLLGFAKITRDITEKRRAAELLEETRLALVQAQKMEAIGKLTGGIAHDFNNVLQSLMGNMELLRLRIALGHVDDLGGPIDTAIAGIKRAAGLTHRLLAFARRQTLTPKPFSPNAMVQSMLDMLQRSVGPDIRLDARLQQAGWWVLCDQNQLENALLNLVINSRDAMPSGGTIQIRTENLHIDETRLLRDARLAPGDYVVLCVADEGAGMSADVLAHACDPFFTTKPSGVGTGLGLSMVHGFVVQSGGCIDIRSQPGEGTTVSLYLPMYEAAAVDAVTEDGGARPLPAARKRVLVVDDEPAVLALLIGMLEQFDYRPVAAQDAREALRHLESGTRIDLLVTDVGLPGGMNGRQLADAARQLHPALKVLMITGFAEQATLGDGEVPAGMRVLSKPFPMEDFIAAVGEMADGPGVKADS